jgi:hypothetical protein
MSDIINNTNEIIDDSSTEKKSGVGIKTLSAPHKRYELISFNLLHNLFTEGILTKDQLNEKLTNMMFSGTVPEKTAYWNTYESKDEESNRKTIMKTFIDTEKAVAKALAKADAKAEAKASAPPKKSKAKKEEEATDPEKVEEVAAAVPEPIKVEEVVAAVPEPIKVEEVVAVVPEPIKVEEVVATDVSSKKNKKKAKKLSEEASIEA